jgi:hypothetical protein
MPQAFGPFLCVYRRSPRRFDGPRQREKVRRGFCSTCGSSLFWDPIQKDWIGIAMGAFDLPTNTKLRIHIHVADKGDYYEIVDGLRQNPH